MNKPLIIVGDSAFAEIAEEYFRYDSDYEPVGFAVEAEYRSRDQLNGLPVVDLESVEATWSPNSHSFFAALTYRNLNRTRTRLYQDMKGRGYSPASYISSQAFVWRNVRLGEHCFVFEDNVIQPFVKVGSNVIFWSGNHIGHHSTVGDNCFVSSHVCLSGFCDVQRNCFLGVNSTIGNNVTIGAESWLSPGVAITRDVPSGTLVKMNRPRLSEVSTWETFDLEQPES